jgi:glucose/arabinose dehydrogenase
MKQVNYSILFCFIGWILFSGCARVTPTGEKQNTTEQEDLADIRPRFEYVEPTVKVKPVSTIAEKPATEKDKPSADLSVNIQLGAALDTMARQNKLIRYISGFRIQIYSGNVRSQADAAKAYVYQNFPNLMPYVTYTQPSYRVKVGDFMYRSDAEAYLLQMKDQYTSAMIVAEKVEIKKGLASRYVSK